jgi:predicted  nucleic acid-binding Zn-ribbon protein
VKADPFAQLKLLDVQQLDSRLDQLRHQLASMPQIAELNDLLKRHSELSAQVRDARIAVEDLTRAQKKADADVEQVKARRTRDQQRIDQGVVTNPKDLERMQHELVSLERRISELEDAELEVMEQLEDAQRELDQRTAELAEVDRRVAEVNASRDETAARIDKELAEVATQRGQTASDMPEDLMALYTKLRDHKGGVGAAALRARRCGGCSLELDHSELASIAKQPSDAVVRCEECGRILVRTHESGL